MELARAYRLIGSAYSWLPRRLGGGRALPPLRVALVLTHRCNLRCTMCNVWARAEEPDGSRLEGRELDTAELLSVIGQTPRASVVTFTGGEPFARPDIWPLLEAAAARRRVHLVTNGTLIGAEAAGRLADLGSPSVWRRGLLSLGVSIEGPAEEHDRIVQVPGSHARTVAAVKAVAEARARRGRRYPYIDLKVVVTRHTLASLAAVFELAEEVGADLVSYQMENTQSSAYAVEDGRPEAHREVPPPVEPIDPAELAMTIAALRRRARGSRVQIRFNPAIPLAHLQARYQNRFPLADYGCQIAWTVMHVGPCGDVFPCYSYSMGNVRQASLARIWNGPRYREFRRRLARERIWPGCVGCCVMHYLGREETL